MKMVTCAQSILLLTTAMKIIMLQEHKLQSKNLRSILHRNTEWSFMSTFGVAIMLKKKWGKKVIIKFPEIDLYSKLNIDSLFLG